MVRERWKSICPSCYDAEAELARVRYQFLERAHCRGAYTTESRSDDRRSMREFLSWILCPVMWPLAIFVGNPRWRVKEGEGFEA
mgnify:CR=1 FL=1